MRDAEFEWDDAKAARNWVAHSVSFETARRAFDDPSGVAVEDVREDYGEMRFNLLALVQEGLLHVTYTYRGERIRIISARGAEPHERRIYHKENRES
ncbi:MAG: BrnT family toxin [Hyphomicrobium sp.]